MPAKKQAKSTPRATPQAELIKALAKNSLELQSKIVDLIQTNSDLLKAQTNTSKDISSMVALFKEAGEHMVVETEEERLRPLLSKITELVEQNKTIMRGLILIQKYIRSSTATDIPQKPISPEEF
ncbi:MAG: hypothetical protein CMH62_00045 [Nanoarchaeota archaeon]|nr:hypothetical protein [Nanoarchaeota archaeon]|tara:strand:- start:423 stop:797 length:375 start_codon:yes stop_codon:yes gene_type:complete